MSGGGIHVLGSGFVHWYRFHPYKAGCGWARPTQSWLPSRCLSDSTLTCVCLCLSCWLHLAASPSPRCTFYPLRGLPSFRPVLPKLVRALESPAELWKLWWLGLPLWTVVSLVWVWSCFFRFTQDPPGILMCRSIGELLFWTQSPPASLCSPSSFLSTSVAPL